jgi:hypothetical protein
MVAFLIYFNGLFFQYWNLLLTTLHLHLDNQFKVKVKVTLWDSQSVSQKIFAMNPTWGLWPYIYYFLIVTILCFCGAPSLTRGRVCLLYMLLALANAVFLGFESLGTHDHILLSQIWDFPFHLLLRLAVSRWRYSTQSANGWDNSYNCNCRYIGSVPTTHRKHSPIVA